MGDVSLRTRLTVALILLTGVLSSLAVLVGMSTLRTNAREAAVARLLTVYSEVGVSSGFEGAIGDEEGFLVSEILGIDPIEFNRFEIELTLSVIEQQGIFPDLVAAFGADDASIWLLLNTGSVARLGESGTIDFEPVPAKGDTLVVASSISDAGVGGIFESLDQVDRTFEYGSTTRDGVTIGVVADVTAELGALDDVATALWIAAAILTVLSGAAAWLLVGRALSPVGAITRRVSEITAGNLSERVPVPPRRDEIGRLATTMNTMLGRLETGDLRRRQFISDASHELRTPVAVLRSEAEVARRAPDSTTIDELSSVVLNESQRLGGMVEDLLAIARSDEPGRRVESGNEVDVDEIVLAESERSRDIAVDRSAVSAGRVRGHQDDVGRIITHLLDNAARHADDQVAVGVRTESDQVLCWVDDDGPGIPVGDRRRIFDRFVRLDDARTRDRGGAGLGLAVVASTVEKMGGTVDVADAPLGGARFVVAWPAA